MSIKRLVVLRLLSVLLVTTIVAAACGDDDSAIQPENHPTDRQHRRCAR